MTQSIHLARSELKKAKAIIDLAETRAMCVDGPVAATREMMTNNDFDIFARHVLKALAYLTPKGTRGDGLRKIISGSARRRP
jgi:hypothetical protein